MDAETLKQLFAEFPPDAIHWRAQTLSKDGTKALALAYLDARDVMDRLDSVCGAENWQDRYEFHGPRTVCYLSIRVGEEWITKADGAGDSDVEAEKGAISDALKRAAVKWGIGRYLYDLGSTWVPCESYDDRNGKKRWSRFTVDPWTCVKGAKTISAAEQKRGLADIDKDLIDCGTILAVDKCAKAWAAKMAGWSQDYRAIAIPKFQQRRETIAANETPFDEEKEAA